MSEIVLKGIPAAPGIAYGQSFILDKGEFIVPNRSISLSEIDSEIARFEEAVNNARREIHSLKVKITQDMGPAHAQIFDAHLLVLQDATLLSQVSTGIRKNKSSAEYVFFTVIKKFVEAFAQMPDEYLRERASDVSDISKRVLKHLMDESKLHDLDSLQDDLIIVAHELSPSDAVSMYNKKIKGFLTDIGGRTSHTAIIAKSLGVPAVVGLKDATLRVNNQDYVIIDGQKGLVIINPSAETKELYIKEQNKITESLGKLDDLKDLPAQTLDGKKISILANLELSSEIPAVRKYGAEGIGLYRTEFLYMNRLDLPSEEEQYQAYAQVARAVTPFGVTIRTLDLGGDKFISSVQIPQDMTPFLGCRAIRFCLERPDIFKTQMRAILRASVHGRIQMMYPMISGLGELRQANAILNQVKTALRDEKILFDEKMKVGIMIEVPAAVMTAEALARETDFFSIGTNDLIQYTLAVDRVNEKTAHLYEPAHPGVLKMIQKTIDAGHNESIHVALCGEMASDPLLAFLLLGMGIDELSMSAASILTVKRMIRSVKLQDAQRIAYEATQLATGQEVEEFVDVQLKNIYPVEENMKALILAAGYGTRLASVIKDTPKPLIPVGNRPLVDYVVDMLQNIKSLTEIVVVSNNKFTPHFEKWASSRHGLPIRVVNDGTNTPEERLGSVGDIGFVWKNESSLDDWLIIGGDNLFDGDLSKFVDFSISKTPAMTIGIYDIHDIQAATKFGVLGIDAGKKVISFQEKPEKPASSLITMCLYYFPKQTLGFLAEYLSESKAVDAAGSYIKWLSEKKNVYGFQFTGKWYDIGSIESLEEARAHFLKN